MQASGLAPAHSIMYTLPNKRHSSSRFYIDGVSKRNQHQAFVKRKTTVDRTDWNRFETFAGEFSGKRDLSGDCVFTRLHLRSARDQLGSIDHFCKRSTQSKSDNRAANRRSISGGVSALGLSHIAYERNSSG